MHTAVRKKIPRVPIDISLKLLSHEESGVSVALLFSRVSLLSFRAKLLTQRCSASRVNLLPLPEVNDSMQSVHAEKMCVWSSTNTFVLITAISIKVSKKSEESKHSISLIFLLKVSIWNF